MKHYSLLTLALFLSACNPQAALNDVAETASGRITEVKDRVNEAVQPVVDTVETLQNGIQKVHSGALMLKEGIDQVKGIAGE